MGTGQPSGTDETALPDELEVGALDLLDPGTRIERYEIVSLIGAGGMGAVYRARDQRLGRHVAIKMLRRTSPGSVSCSMLCSLLLREAQVMARLSHGNLVAVFDIGEFRECAYVAMEFVDGVNLRDWAAGRDWRSRFDALLQSGRALSAAHRAGVVHRDFKPDNVLVTREGDVKVTDFGLARAPADFDTSGIGVGCCGPDTAEPDGFDAGSIVGTPAYMSPEQYRGLPADQRSDQFSFAATCWEILYGALAHAGTTFGELREAIVGERITPVVDADIPADVERLLRRGLRATASARYPSLDSFLNALQAAAGDGVTERPS